jgi:PAS domain S-box-containing protein
MLARSRMKPSGATSLMQLLAGTADGGFASDVEGRIVLWNHAAESMLGYPVNEAVGRPCCELLMGHDDNGNPLCCQSCHVVDSLNMREPAYTFDMRTRTKAGATIWLNVSTLIVSNDGIGDMTIHLFRDVTATREFLALIREHLSIPARLVRAAPEGTEALTRRELEVLRIISRGLNTKDIATKLHVSPATVRNHVQNILGKLGAHSRLEAVAYATRHRLI